MFVYLIHIVYPIGTQRVMNILIIKLHKTVQQIRFVIQLSDYIYQRQSWWLMCSPQQLQ